MPRVVAIIQARMGSTRLPAKVMRPILDKPMLGWVVYRLQSCHLIDRIVVATTDSSSDDAIAKWCETNSIALFRGSENDVLDRYFQAANLHKAELIVRVTSDCPLIDPYIVDYVIAGGLASQPIADYVSNTLERTYPRGLDVEAVTYEALSRSWHEDQSDWREHVTPYIYRNPDKFSLLSITNPMSYSEHRWTVDTIEDFQLVEKIYTHFQHGDFGWQDVIQLVKSQPDWIALNAHIEQKKLTR